MIAADTKLMVRSHRAEHEWNEAALARLHELAAGRAGWAIPWACMHEFIGIVTRPKVFSPPSTLKQTAAQIESGA